jgi:hypothetical protein
MNPLCPLSVLETFSFHLFILSSFQRRVDEEEEEEGSRSRGESRSRRERRGRRRELKMCWKDCSFKISSSPSNC